MAYAPQQNDTTSVSVVAASSSNRSSFTKELVGCRVIRHERDWKWSKQVSKMIILRFNYIKHVLPALL